MAKKKKGKKELSAKPKEITGLDDMIGNGVHIMSAKLGDTKAITGDLVETDRNGVMIQYISRGRRHNMYLPFANIKSIDCVQSGKDDKDEDEE